MKKFNVSILAVSALVLGLAVAGCTPGKDSATSSTEALAKVGTVSISKDQVYEAMKKEAGKRVMSDLIIKEIYKLEAVAQGVTVSDQELDAKINPIKEKMGPEKFQEYLTEEEITEDELRERSRLILLRDKMFEKAYPITEEQIKEYYEKNKEKLDGTLEEVRPKVTEKVKDKNKRSNMSTWIKELKKKHNVQILDKAFEKVEDTEKEADKAELPASK
ncbi:SurA N-terminal domain-containing protein [Brevibacillus porteri]|uniref:peptidylprolyl isomerase n=1 Tax=Brevibacillus porteri TaxID=2126350 RepID=A0ABX5FG78_9BACL|nr:SurA N-terminal domain-containing protein [Brevibacillus porteri]MED1802429.1 SurA N-terminal domain-containing protein [Brevibacillus porteri]MED2129611.1 SurA N-terminal domain-containing protein [Brevibacillus porteri]MED2747481.1 SurA N-terminal domain-containing protein [Brevibacillus porteri]MED2816988.1 SurA N-terminal domain-containing protein [Brevibacillus porteri]MED2894936.1 SurA N-terminal domain-containing protein [Brevibacillus porteri]